MTEALRHARYIAGENPVTLAAGLLFLAFVVLALLGPWLAPFDPLMSDTDSALQPPSARHWFGTDALGRDILARVMVATRLDFGIALAAGLLSFGAGSALGAVAGYYGGWVDRLAGRLDRPGCHHPGGDYGARSGAVPRAADGHCADYP